ncbi:MAG: HAD family phosphatase, partial [Lactobacillus sp.]|nr:HAD family phosphatase [Lactobacillus sp.]
MQVKEIKDDIKGIILDMDGLLVNSEELYWQANIQAA